MAFRVPEKFRVFTGDIATKTGDLFGYFFVRQAGQPTLRVMACADGEGWDHVSVSLPDRTPTWAEMCRVKSLFWDDEDCVMQLHPPRSDYINCHPYCLHLWRPTDGRLIPLPPSWMVGPPDVSLKA
jgi:hypothetical protein